MSASRILTQVLRPGEAAARLGMPVADLVERIKLYRYPFVELKPGGQPGDPGRNRWGLTIEQFEAILRGMERLPPDPTPEDAPARRRAMASPDGKSRLRRPKRRRG